MSSENIFSRRTHGWTTAPNPLSVKLEQLRASGVRILDLTISNPTLCGFASPDLAALNHPENNLYEPDAHGLKTSREAIARYYRNRHSITLDENQIFITAGTSEAYSFVFKLLTDPGDSILAPRPSYPLLHYLAELHDLKLVHKEEAKTRASLLVHPNNPTGKYAPAPQEAGIPLIVDEVFLDYSFGPKPSSFAGYQKRLCFTLSGISKILALPQMKISWIVVTGPEKLRDEAIEKLDIIADTYLSASTPSQHALPVWLSQTDAVQSEIKNRLAANLAAARAIFSGSRIKLTEPEGGWYAVLEMPDHRTDEEWALDLLEKTGVLAHPGYLFDFEEEKFLVLSLLPRADIFSEGVKRMREITEK